jgi:phosphatidylglycerophosphate synthase
MKYSSIRKLHYKNQRKKHLQMNIDLDDWFYSPYSSLKARFFIELSALIVSFLQYTPIRPNFITLLFAASAIAGGFCLSSGSENLIILGVIIFFTYSIFDWTDGPLALVTKKTSHLGHIFDAWGGLVGSFSFLIGIGMYLFNQKLNK